MFEEHSKSVFSWSKLNWFVWMCKQDNWGLSPDVCTCLESNAEANLDRLYLLKSC